MSVIERVKDMRTDDKSTAANERMDEMTEEEKALKATKEMKDSAPGEDRVRSGYILNACDEAPERVIEIVKMIFDERANDENATIGIIVPLFKKVERLSVNKYRGTCMLSMCSWIALANTKTHPILLLTNIGPEWCAEHDGVFRFSNFVLVFP